MGSPIAYIFNQVSETLFQGGVKVPTGGKAHEPSLFGGVDPVRFRGRRYSPDERNSSESLCLLCPFASIAKEHFCWQELFRRPPGNGVPQKAAPDF